MAFIRLKNTISLPWTIGIWAAAWLAILAQIVHPWIPVDERKLKTYELKKFDEFLPIVKQYPGAVWASTYQMASVLSYRSQIPVYKLAGSSRVDFFDFRSEAVPKIEHFYLLVEPEQMLPQRYKDAGFAMINQRFLTDELRILEVQFHAPSTDR